MPQYGKGGSDSHLFGSSTYGKQEYEKKDLGEGKYDFYDYIEKKHNVGKYPDSGVQSQFKGDYMTQQKQQQIEGFKQNPPPFKDEMVPGSNYQSMRDQFNQVDNK